MNVSRKFILPLLLVFMAPLASMGLAGNAHAASAGDCKKTPRRRSTG